MSAPTMDRPDVSRDEPHPGPAEVLAALATFSPPETIAMISGQIDEAYQAGRQQHDSSPLEKVLDYWWHVVRVARGEVDPPMRGNALEETIARWEAKHPGQRFPR